jgi:hypothetical protein
MLARRAAPVPPRDRLSSELQDDLRRIVREQVCFLGAVVACCETLWKIRKEKVGVGAHYRKRRS